MTLLGDTKQSLTDAARKLSTIDTAIRSQSKTQHYYVLEGETISSVKLHFLTLRDSFNTMNDPRLKTTLLSTESVLYRNLSRAYTLFMTKFGDIVPVKSAVQRETKACYLWQEDPLSMLFPGSAALESGEDNPIKRWVAESSRTPMIDPNTPVTAPEESQVPSNDILPMSQSLLTKQWEHSVARGGQVEGSLINFGETVEGNPARH